MIQARKPIYKSKKKIVQRDIPSDKDIQHDTLPPLLRRIYLGRGISDSAELDNRLQSLIPYQTLLGIEDAALIIADAIQTQQRIVVVGDYDADGATSTTVAIRSLRALGAECAEYLLPNRFEYGYGLTPEIVELARERFQPDLIITVDNGIASIDGVAYANSHQIKVVITDHHLPADTLPLAAAIVNPNQPNDPFPSKNLAGVGVIFYVMLAVRAVLRAQKWFATREEPNLAHNLDLVALGTVADVVPLDHTNRILVHQGLARIRAKRCSPGILALLQVAQRAPEKLVASDLGFVVGPRLNAAGRLDDMSLGVACLLTDNSEQALIYARELDSLNAARKAIETEMQEQAELALEKLRMLGETHEDLPPGIALYNTEWHQGVIGILAGRVKERLNCPTICFANSDDDSGLIKGSARSIQGVHIRDVLDIISKQHPLLIVKFGGHAMAAGLTLQEKDFPFFAHVFTEQVSLALGGKSQTQEVMTDGMLSQDDFSLDQAQLLREAGPWGQNFPEPSFFGIFKVKERRILGEKHLKMRLQPMDGEKIVEAIAFNLSTEELQLPSEIVQCAYKLDINEFRGQRTLQLLIDHIEPHEI